MARLDDAGMDRPDGYLVQAFALGGQEFVARLALPPRPPPMIEPGPEIGQTDYVAANAFLDAFAVARARTGEAALAIGWDAWRETGMALATEVPEEWKAWRQESLAQGLASREGIEAFRRIAASGLPQVVVSTVDNLLGGAATPALRSLNLAFGFPELQAIDAAAH